ncbi:four helix bundle protein [Salinimicrobium sp. MT39]|uniref:Four helix bundle protein n=1 Tax=Salinimicrobium profundisediminis TaxID=2994553 RepID=A0A9X3CU16_9FLAO|nr:four helix bundle protein [Salinimicrobium profundisediminis]MCX2836656.1 four helix bundle protein [Salinimicrobium profundisediminis]
MHKLSDLKIWNKAMDVAELTYLLSAKFPSEEKFGLTSQIRRSAISVPSNVAEGAGRSTKGEYKNFLSIANGSSYELLTQLILSHRLNLVPEEDTREVISEVIEIQKMNYALIKSLEK